MRTLFRNANEWTTAGGSLFERAVASQPWDRKIHEGTDPGHGEPAVRGNEVHGPWRRLVGREQDLELTPPYMLGDVIGQQARHATPGQSRSQHRAHAVAYQARRELDRSR